MEEQVVLLQLLTMTYGGTTNGLKHVNISGIIESHTTTGAQKITTTYRSC